MNIFVLDEDVTKCAQYHLDKHCVKMVLETTQLLNNALLTNDPFYNPVYKQSHKNHPASLWATQSKGNFDWLNNLGLALCEEYTYRYNKIHKCQELLYGFKNNTAIFKEQERTPFALCMPDQYKVESAIESYRNYYRGDKAYIAIWTKRNEPEWWNNGTV